MCTTEDAMAAAILLQMSSHGGHSGEQIDLKQTNTFSKS